MSASQWNLRWPYVQQGGPLPVVNDTTPDPLARLTALNGQRQAAAQDSKNTWDYQPGGQMSVDYASPGQTSGSAPAQGGGTFGYSYSSPGQGFNPWGMYDGRNGYDGTASDGVGLYQAGKDSAKGWGPNGTPETDRDRVWRMTLDALKSGDNPTGKQLDPGSADPAVVQATFLNEVARLHRDYNNTPGLGAAAWANSAFAGYDKLAGGTGSQAGTATQQGGTRGQTGNSASSGTGNTAANNTQYPAGQQAQTGGNAVNPLAIDPSAGSSVLPGGGSVPGANSNQNPTAGQPGYAGFFNLNNPQQAVRDYINGHFGQGAADTNMFFGDWIKKLMGNLIPTIMQLTVGQDGKPALDRLANLNGVIDPLLFGGQGTLGGNLQGFANNAQKALMGSMPGMDASTQADLLRNLTALRTLGDNGYMQQATNNRLDAAIGSAQDQASQVIRNGGKMPNNYSLWDYINNQLPQGYANPFK